MISHFFHFSTVLTIYVPSLLSSFIRFCKVSTYVKIKLDFTGWLCIESQIHVLEHVFLNLVKLLFVKNRTWRFHIFFHLKHSWFEDCFSYVWQLDYYSSSFSSFFYHRVSKVKRESFITEFQFYRVAQWLTLSTLDSGIDVAPGTFGKNIKRSP